jgi:fibro-slime domain-containing protein
MPRIAIALVLAVLAGCQQRRIIIDTPDASEETRADGPPDASFTQPDFSFSIPDAPASDAASVDARVPPDVPVAVCGNGAVEGGEACDDRNTTAGDGCSDTCSIEPDFVCPEMGQPCVRTVVCGDHKVTGGEGCDDGNTTAGDGCSGTCQIEPGWSCARGAACRAVCGDGIKTDTEQCDDHNTTAGDGCSATCTVESPAATEGNGWVCPAAGQPCVRTSCGNGMPEGSEQCDDGNNDTGDGCSHLCRREPVCPAAGGACSSSCGDNLLLPVDIAAGQECDDGNTVSGDGCSSDCKIERGHVCQLIPVVQDALQLPITYRDFKAFGEPNGHPDFERILGDGESGIVLDLLGANAKPVHVADQKALTVNNHPDFANFDYFGVWYKDDLNYNRTIQDFLTFVRLPTGAFQFANADFFPIDGRGWGNFMGGTDLANNFRNFHFTSELRQWFEYRGGEQLDFTGDDDLWVFINKHLAVDLGGLHEAFVGSVTLDASNGTGQVCDLLSPCPTRRSVDLGLALGSVYEIVVFQAERHTQASNYKLTLSNFNGARSSCRTVCGDGVVTPDEACDLGMAGNTGAYGTCNPDCTLPPGCGDGVVNGMEECDDGVNRALHGGSANMRLCGPGCLFAGYCGDGVKNGPEQCDLGALNEPTPYGIDKCTTACTASPYCGDGRTQPEFGEECDGGSMCTAMCKLTEIP